MLSFARWIHFWNVFYRYNYSTNTTVRLVNILPHTSHHTVIRQCGCEGVWSINSSDQMTSNKRRICETSDQCEWLMFMWVTLCRFKVLIWASDFPHTSQEKSFSPMCVRRWWVRFNLCAHKCMDRRCRNMVVQVSSSMWKVFVNVNVNAWRINHLQDESFLGTPVCVLSPDRPYQRF